jgi:hypothetical protein
LNAIGDEESSRAHLKFDIPRLKRRAAVLLNKSILFSTFAAITTSVLVIVAFVSAYFNVASSISMRCIPATSIVLFRQKPIWYTAQ